MSSDKIVWGIHGGRMGEADTLFLQKNVIAIGWVQMGDVSKIKPTRDAYKEAFAHAYPDRKPAAVPT